MEINLICCGLIDMDTQVVLYYWLIGQHLLLFVVINIKNH